MSPKQRILCIQWLAENTKGNYKYYASLSDKELTEAIKDCEVQLMNNEAGEYDW
ncbi:hypothetical protein [Aquibacillus kalidii]|uniref:hypothetical protein n=1 Tax=Aquibacillus kalidii TaxID=2762597 RepID=UPI001648355C|nr:hypothetical protein [Aquibacillus kalidii]